MKWRRRWRLRRLRRLFPKLAPMLDDNSVEVLWVAVPIRKDSIAYAADNFRERGRVAEATAASASIAVSKLVRERLPINIPYTAPFEREGWYGAA